MGPTWVDTAHVAPCNVSQVRVEGSMGPTWVDTAHVAPCNVSQVTITECYLGKTKFGPTTRPFPTRITSTFTSSRRQMECGGVTSQLTTKGAGRSHSKAYYAVMSPATLWGQFKQEVGWIYDLSPPRACHDIVSHKLKWWKWCRPL